MNDAKSLDVDLKLLPPRFPKEGIVHNVPDPLEERPQRHKKEKMEKQQQQQNPQTLIKETVENKRPLMDFNGKNF